MNKSRERLEHKREKRLHYRNSKKIRGFFHPKTIVNYCIWKPSHIFSLPFYLFGCSFLKGYKDIRRIFLNVLLEYRYLSTVKFIKGKQVKDIVSCIALYLPQFHQTVENDEWWGEGFTEWTNCKTAVPLFNGHYQPHVPHPDIGYYDLSDVNVMRKQANMAKEYGVSGFCFYYYWFQNGQRMLEKPINNWLETSDINFPFCFCWANENWTRTWTGGGEILMEQDHGVENLTNMIREMIKAFKDDRYITINGKPVLLVYRAELIPDIQVIVQMWQDEVKKAGLPGVYLVSVENVKAADPDQYGFDAALEFAPSNLKANVFFSNSKIEVEKHSNLNFHSYTSAAQNLMYRPDPGYKRFRSVFPGWDNSPRRKNNEPRIYHGNNLNEFKKHLTRTVKYTISYFPEEERLFFINAWNEWGEGAHLEPDEKNGHAYLQTVKDIMEIKLEKESTASQRIFRNLLRFRMF